MALPIPELDPVIKATLPLSLFTIIDVLDGVSRFDGSLRYVVPSQGENGFLSLKW